MISLFHDTLATPLGDFSVAVDAAGSVVATAFGDLAVLQNRLRSSRRRGPVGRGVSAEPPTSPAHRDGSPDRDVAQDAVAVCVSARPHNPAAHAAGHDGDRAVEWITDQRRTAFVRAQVDEYFAGKRHTFDLPLAPTGSAFQQRVWAALRKIPFGTTRSYAQLAAALGLSGSARAVGGANAANPICLLVPCHRVIGSDGSLTGFAFGEERKRALLAHERALVLA